MNQHIYTERQLARGYTHYIYRNTVIEDLHSAGTILDDEAYRKIYRTVATKVERIKKYRQYLYLLDCGKSLPQELDQIPRDHFISVMHFMEEIVLNCDIREGWDEAELIHEMPQQSIAHYILDGKFKECCDKNAQLTDEVMCYINKDIYNRVYTLVVNELL